jgi:UDP-N-acetylglucosamine diphosphorylase / glucose-1-phosphate thymidylyltransferase / UDP-N-acetylgalactosamine diphosphorylase / glucosamine-1-phosphate N-acetyltransferase / galactosamine-1-phosphate N-acetyltransferase
MKAVILAAGKGTRMKDLTREIPKPMVPVRGTPILETIITRLRDGAGLHDFFIIIGYCGDVIRDHFQNGEKWGVSITYGEQTVQDGTGKAPELAQAWVGSSPFLLSYGDILVEAADYKLLVEGFTADGVIALKDGVDLSLGGAVILNEAGLLIDLVEKGQFTSTPPNAYYNAGIYIFSPQIFTHTAALQKSPRGEYELTDAVKALALANGKIRGVILQQSWADVRDPEVLAELNQPS